MTKLILYDRKNHKKSSPATIEIDLEDLESYAEFKANALFSDIPKKIIGNKSLIEWYSHENYSFWWFINPILSPKFNEITLFLDRLEKCVILHKIKKIELKGCFDKSFVIQKFCDLNNIELDVDKKLKIKFDLTSRYKKNFKKLYYKKITEKKYQKRLTVFKKFNNPIFEKNSLIITSHGLYRRENIDVDTGKKRKEEFFIQPILNFYSKKIPILCFDIDYTLHGQTKALEERLQSNVNWIPADFLLVKPKSSKTNEVLKILENSYKKMLKNNPENEFFYKKIPIWNFLQDTLDEMFYEPYLPSYVHLVHELESFFDEYSPVKIVQTYEAGSFAKAFEIAAKKTNIKTVGIQHGAILDSAHDYMTKNLLDDENPLGNPIPDTTLVFGDYYKQLLINKGKYPSSKIQISGNLSLYNVNELKNLLIRKNLLKKYNLDDKKIILIILSNRLTFTKNNPDVTLLEHVHNCLKDQDCIVLVRPHPGDELTEEIFRKFCPSLNFKLSLGNSLFEDIAITDIVIAMWSTVGIEAALFEKPVLFTTIEDTDSTLIKYDFVNEMVKGKAAKFSPISTLCSDINSINKGELWRINDVPERSTTIMKFLNYGNSINLEKLIGVKVDDNEK